MTEDGSPAGRRGESGPPGGDSHRGGDGRAETTVLGGLTGRGPAIRKRSAKGEADGSGGGRGAP